MSAKLGINRWNRTRLNTSTILKTGWDQPSIPVNNVPPASQVIRRWPASRDHFGLHMAKLYWALAFRKQVREELEKAFKKVSSPTIKTDPLKKECDLGRKCASPTRTSRQRSLYARVSKSEILSLCSFPFGYRDFNQGFEPFIPSFSAFLPSL